MRSFTIILILFILLLSGSSYAQTYRAGEKIPSDMLREDLAVLKRVLEGVHIGLYRYTPKKTVDSLFSDAFTRSAQPMTEIDFFKLVNPIVTSIRDEHTFALPSEAYMRTEIGQTRYTDPSSNANAKLFPFFIKIIGKRLFIDNNLSDDLSLKTGDEIISINGKPVKQVIDILLPTIATNGYSGTFQPRHLEQFSLQQTYNRFMVHYAIFIGCPEEFELKIKRADGTALSTVKVNALPSKAIFNNYWRRYSSVNDIKKHNEDPLEFKLTDPKTGYLRLSDFHIPAWSKYNYSYSTEFRTIFELIKRKNIQNLIIDLRGNEGGNLAIGAQVLRYICTRPYRPYQYHEVIAYKFPQLKKYFRDSTAMPVYPDELFIPTGSGTYRSDPQYKTEEMSRLMQPFSNPYVNKIYVLIDGATGSAASMLATLIRVNRRDAIFIGEESGGDIEGPVSGTGADITLPGSKIRVDIPFIKRVMNLEGYPHLKGRGIIPDHPVVADVNDLINGEDTQLKFTLNLIQGSK